MKRTDESDRAEPVDLDAWRAEAGAMPTFPRWLYPADVQEWQDAARAGWPRDATRVGVLCAEIERLRACVAAWRAHQLAALDYVPHPASIEDRCALEKRREAAWTEVMRVDPGWEREAEETARREGAER